MPKLNKAQVMIIDGVLSLLVAIILSFVLFAAWPQTRHPSAELTLERAGYDIANAFYEDETLYQTIRKGLETKGYLSAGEVSYLSTRLYTYGRLLGVGRIDIDVDGSTSFSVEMDSSLRTRSEQFPLILPLKGGAENRLVRVTLWR